MAKGIVKGDREIIANMRRTRISLTGGFVESISRQALEPMKEETEGNARMLRNFPGKHPGWPQPSGRPRGGHLDENVVIVRHRKMGPMAVEIWLTFRGRGMKLAHLVEFGTAPHWQPGLKIMHPGASAYPFARPAFETKKQDVGMAMGRLVWQRISSSLIGSNSR